MDHVINKLFKQSSHYFSGHILALIPHFISFPILTRALSRGDYGTLNLLMVTLTLSAAISKLGLQHSAVRFYSEYQKQNSEFISEYYSTLFLTPLISGLAVAGIFVFILKMHYIPESIINTSTLGLFFFISMLIPIRTTIDTSMQFIRAEQRTKLYNSFKVLLRYTALGLTLFFLFHLIKGLYGFLFGMLMARIFGLLFLYFAFLRNQRIIIRSFSTLFLKDCLYFGLPLLFVELGHTLLSIGDRFVIQYFLGASSLGIYAAGYNLASYVGDALILPLRSASTPIYLDIWSNKGEAATKEFLSDSLRYLLLILIPVGFGFTCVSEELITLLASSKYAEASIIIPWIMAGVVIYGTRIILDAPLYIYKKTFWVLILMLSSCILNIGLNIFLIPGYGIRGAAMATLIANAAHILMVVIVSFRMLSFKIHYYRIFTYVFASALMFFIVRPINAETLMLSLFIKIIIGMLIYSLLVFLLDSDLRLKLSRLVHEISGRRTRQPWRR